MSTITTKIFGDVSSMTVSQVIAQVLGIIGIAVFLLCFQFRVTVDIRIRCRLFLLALFAPVLLARSYLASHDKHKNHTKLTA